MRCNVWQEACNGSVMRCNGRQSPCDGGIKLCNLVGRLRWEDQESCNGMQLEKTACD